MKKLLLISILILVSLSGFTQIKRSSFIEFGYEDRIATLYNFNGYIGEDLHLIDLTKIDKFRNSLFGTLSTEFSYKGIKLYTNVKTYFKPIEVYSYRPSLMVYTLGASYTIKFITFKYEHMCTHSVDIEYFKESYDRISVKIVL